MFNSKAISLFISLSAAERRRFKRWLASPIYNSNDLLSRFYEFLETRSEFTELTLRRDRAFGWIYGNIEYDDLKIRRIMSEFLSQSESFLAHEWVQKNEIAKALNLSKQLRARQLHNGAKESVLVAKQELSAQPYRGTQYHLESYWIQEEQLLQNPARDAAINLQEIANELTAFFVAEMLRNACIAASHQSVYKSEYELPYLDLILADCAAGRYQHIQVINLYHHIYRCLSDDGAKSHFEALKNLLPTVGQWLTPPEVRNVFLLSINYGIRRLNQEGPGFMSEVFVLYRLGLEEGTLVENGQISRFTFKNIVSMALALKEYGWVSKFIDDYASYLPTPYRVSYENFCRAKLLYQTNDKAAAQSLLSHLDTDDIFLNLDTRVLLLKIYVELKEWRLLHGYLQSFERFVTRKKKLAYHAPNYLNIIQFTGRLAQHYSGKRRLNAEELALLQGHIEQAKPLTEKAWLLGLMMD